MIFKYKIFFQYKFNLLIFNLMTVTTSILG